MENQTYKAAYNAAYEIEGKIADLGLGQEARTAYKESLATRLHKALYGE